MALRSSSTAANVGSAGAPADTTTIHSRFTSYIFFVALPLTSTLATSVIIFAELPSAGTLPSHCLASDESSCRRLKAGFPFVLECSYQQKTACISYAIIVRLSPNSAAWLGPS